MMDTPNGDMQLQQFFLNNNLGAYLPRFIEEEVDFDTFLTYGADDLIELGVNKKGPRDKLLLLLNNIRASKLNFSLNSDCESDSEEDMETSSTSPVLGRASLSSSSGALLMSSVPSVPSNNANEELFVFVDDSNLWIEAQRLLGQLNGLQKSDSRARVNVSALRRVLAQHQQPPSAPQRQRRIVRTVVYGSGKEGGAPDRETEEKPVGYPSDLVNVVWGPRSRPQRSSFSSSSSSSSSSPALSESLTFVKSHKRSAWTGKEKAVDAQMTADITELVTSSAASATAASHRTLVLVCGDGDFVPCVKKALDYGWKVEVWFWAHSTSRALSEDALRHSNYRNLPLDPHFADVVYTSWKWKGRVPPQQAVVLQGLQIHIRERDIEDAFAAAFLEMNRQARQQRTALPWNPPGAAGAGAGEEGGLGLGLPHFQKWEGSDRLVAVFPTLDAQHLPLFARCLRESGVPLLASLEAYPDFLQRPPSPPPSSSSSSSSASSFRAAATQSAPALLTGSGRTSSFNPGKSLRRVASGENDSDEDEDGSSSSSSSSSSSPVSSASASPITSDEESCEFSSGDRTSSSSDDEEIAGFSVGEKQLATAVVVNAAPPMGSCVMGLESVDDGQGEWQSVGSKKKLSQSLPKRKTSSNNHNNVGSKTSFAKRTSNASILRHSHQSFNSNKRILLANKA